MSNQSALVSLPAGLSLPASASVKQTRDVAKNLLRLAGESALASGTVKPETSYAFGLGLALLGACDNQSAPLVRVKPLWAKKPNKAQSARLQY